jgi:plasmid stabilization system protein ParE
MADILLLPAAEADYQAALAWYFAVNPRVANRFEDTLAKALQRIAENPHLYGLIDDRHRQCILHRFPYSLIYRIEKGDVLVVAIAQSRRSSSYWQGRA